MVTIELGYNDILEYAVIIGDVHSNLVWRIVEELEDFEAVGAELSAEEDVDQVGVGDDVDLEVVVDLVCSFYSSRSAALLGRLGQHCCWNNPCF